MTARALVFAVSLSLSAQEGPSLFQLWLPDFYDSPFEGGKALIEVPDRPIKRLHILVREPEKRKLHSGHYKVFVNGKGLGNVLEEQTVPEGTLLVMDPETLRMRPDELFDPRENALEIIAESRNGRRFYQNWLVRVNDTDRNTMFGNFSVISPHDPKGVPPDLNIAEPTTPPLLHEGQPSMSVRLRGTLSKGAALQVNGETISSTGTGQIAEFERTLTVTRNMSEIRVEAADEKGNLRRVVIPVFRQTPNTRPVRFAGQKYAVLIGISNFGSHPGAPPAIALVATEAEQMALQLEKKAGFKRENIRLLTNEKANLEQVRIALSDFAARAQSNDLLLVYIATHGMHDPRPNYSNRLYFAVHGTQLAQLESTALGFSDVDLLLNRGIRTNQCFLMFDVGHKLENDWKFILGKNLVNNHLFRLLADKPQWSLLVSGSADESSIERKDSQATLFGYWLLQALSGAADVSGDSVVTAKELFTFVSEKVKDESGGVQTPRFRIALAEQQIGLNQ